MSTAGQTYGEVVGAERLHELVQQYVERVPDNEDPNAPGFRKDVSLEQARELGSGPEAMFAYECLHFFLWRDQLYCRECGCLVLAGWMLQHRDKLHGLRLGFGF